jgi:hypothetical protein
MKSRRFSCSVHGADAGVRYAVPAAGQPAAAVAAAPAPRLGRLALPQGVRQPFRVHASAEAQLHQRPVRLLTTLLQLQQEPQKGDQTIYSTLIARP